MKRSRSTELGRPGEREQNRRSHSSRYFTRARGEASILDIFDQKSALVNFTDPCVTTRDASCTKRKVMRRRLFPSRRPRLSPQPLPTCRAASTIRPISWKLTMGGCDLTREFDLFLWHNVSNNWRLIRFTFSHAESGFGKLSVPL